jgi:hypothetical protein
MRWFLTLHALRRMRQMSVPREEVIATVDDAESTYPVGSGLWGNPRRTAVSGRLAVIYSPVDRVVVTVLWAGRESRDAA